MTERLDLSAYDAPSPPPDLARNAVATAKRRAARRVRRRMVAAIGVAAVAAAAILLWTRSDRPGSIAAAGQVRADATTELAIGQRAHGTAGAGAEVRWQVSARGDVQVEQLSGRVSYDVKPGGPFVVETPAAVVAVRGTRFSVEVIQMSSNKKSVGIAAGAIGAIAVVVIVQQGNVSVANDHGTVDVRAGETARTTGAAAPVVARQDKARRPAVRRFRDKKARLELAAAITRARTEREARKQAAAEPTPATPPEDPDRPAPPPASQPYIDGIRDTMRDALPMLKDCYMLARHESPELEGKATFEIMLAGEPEVGGLVEEATLIRDSPPGPGEPATKPNPLAENATFSECMVETMLSLEFEPPEHGGRLKLRYPFTFRSTPDTPEEDD